jgi:1,4-dihydroxy-2-naphthoyl-CoA hydrolase
MTQGSPFDETYGLELLSWNEEAIEAIVPVRRHLLQVTGLVHGGVYAAMAEALASLGTNHGVRADNQIALGASNHTSFLRPISEGTIRAKARRVHAGKTTWVWDVEFFDSEERLCSISRITVAVRPRGAGTPRPSR